jgi:hypothetical protein
MPPGALSSCTLEGQPYLMRRDEERCHGLEPPEVGDLP